MMVTELALKREKLEKKIMEEKIKIEEYFIDNTPVHSSIQLGESEDTVMTHAMDCAFDEYLKTNISDVMLIEMKDKIYEKIDELNKEKIEEMEAVLNGR